MSSKHRLVSVRMVRRRLEQVQKRFSSAGIFAIIFIGTKSPKVIQEIVHGILPCEISYPHTKRNTSYRSLPIGQPRIIFRFTGPGCCFFMNTDNWNTCSLMLQLWQSSSLFQVYQKVSLLRYNLKGHLRQWCHKLATL